MKIIKKGNQDLISAKELHVGLGIKRDYSTWIKQSIQRAELEDGKDFTSQKGESTGGRPTIEYYLVRDAALSVIMMSGGKLANSLRKTVIDLYNQHDTGLAFSSTQIMALMELSKAMTLISIQKDVERKHHALFSPTEKWAGRRAEILGYSKSTMIEAMKAVNKKYKSIRASLLHLDAAELIRMGVIDFMMIMGKTEEYATNVGNLCKTMAKEMELDTIIWDDTKPNPLKINEEDVNERKKKYGNAQKLLS